MWIGERIHSRLHRGIGAIPAERLAPEVPLLGALPRTRFDTAYVEAHRVHVAIPQIEWRGVRYSVPPRCLGQRVEVHAGPGRLRLDVGPQGGPGRRQQQAVGPQMKKRQRARFPTVRGASSFRTQ